MICDNCKKEITDAYYACKFGTYCSDSCHELFHPKYYAKNAEGKFLPGGIDEKHFPFCLVCRRNAPVEGYDDCASCLLRLGIKVKVETIQKQ